MILNSFEFTEEIIQVEPEETAKSVSNEVTFEEDTSDTNLIRSTLLSLCEKVSSRLRSAGLKGKTITMKIRLEGFETHTHAATLDMSTNFADMIYREIKKLYSGFKTRGRKVRLIGVKVSNLSPSDLRESLFTDEADKKREVVHRAVEEIKERFGYGAIYRAGSRAKR